MEIILIRHGKPNISTSKSTSAIEFGHWIDSYNASGLCSSSIPSEKAIAVAQKCNAVVCSELQRSIESSKALGIKNIEITSSIFNEAGLPVSNWQYPKMSPKLWAALFRVLWIFGYSKNSESFKEAKVRASEAAGLLIDLANTHGRVLFVGHGVYNRLLANELKALGWAGPKNPGSKHWSFGIYAGKQT